VDGILKKTLNSESIGERVPNVELSYIISSECYRDAGAQASPG